MQRPVFFVDPDPGSGAFLTPGSGIQDPGWVNHQDSEPGSGIRMNISDHISESLETIFWVKILKFFDVDADPDQGSGIFLNLDPE